MEHIDKLATKLVKYEDYYNKLKDQITKKQILAEAKIEQLARDANNLIQTQITSTAIAATILILEQKLDTEEQEKLINSSIQELSLALKN